MRLVELPEVGDRILYVNPEQVVCLIDAGNNRTQIVTTGLSGESSMSLIVALKLGDVARMLDAQAVGSLRQATSATVPAERPPAPTPG